jgi:hypothetical protein
MATDCPGSECVMGVELRTAPGRPNAEPARGRWSPTALPSWASLCVPVTELVGHYPSPSVRIDGVDVMRPDCGPPVGDACRLDAPTRERVLEALQAAAAQRR